MAAEGERDTAYDQDQLRFLIDLLPDIVLLLRPGDGRILGVNAVALKAYGFKLEELLSRTIHNLRAPDTRESIGGQLAAADASGFRFETIHQRKNGETFPVEVNSRGTILDGERVLLSVVRDVSERYRAEATLRESERKFSQAFHGSPGYCAISTLAEGRFIDVNEPFLRSVGRSRDEVIGHTVNELKFWNDPEQARVLREHIKAHGSVTGFESKFVDGSGQIGYGLVSAAVIDVDGTACLLTETVDITARKQAVVGVAHLGLDGKWLRVNQKLCEILGYSQDELLKTNLQSLTHPDDVEADRAALRDLRSGKIREYTCEKRYIRKDGSVVWAFLASTLVVSNLGEPLYFSSIVEDITHKKRAVDDLKLFKASVDRAPHSAYWFDADGRCVYANDAGCRALGYEREELLQMHISGISHRRPERWAELFDEVREKGSISLQSTHYRKDGTPLQVDITSSYLRHGEREYCIGFAVDITERLRAQHDHDKLLEQFNQAQKMESVGRLAGGVAHDFNNMLTIIQLSTQQALEQVDRNQPVHEDLTDIANATRRSADLTRQLLTFARKQTIAPQVLDLNGTVGGMLKILGRLLGENLDLEWRPAADLWPVSMDPSQIDQLLANLCVNSRDAISDVGKVTIQTANQSFDAAECASRTGFTPGDYVQLTVSDNGCGMDEQTLANIFEPFFTTKAAGKGTGLGLATVYGIVKQNGGLIDVSSAPQRGTTISVYLPRYLGVPEPLGIEVPSRRMRSASETVLVVEDERVIAKMIKRTLARKGYTVLVAHTPTDAIRIASEHSGQIQLLLTDVILPEMNGHELSVRLMDHFPRVRCLFMSGYTADAIAHHGVLKPNVSFISKPFSAEGLTCKVREVLDSET